MKVYEAMAIRFQEECRIGCKVECELSENAKGTRLRIILRYDETLTPKDVLKLQVDDVTWSTHGDVDIPTTFRVGVYEYTLATLTRKYLYNHLNES